MCVSVYNSPKIVSTMEDYKELMFHLNYVWDIAHKRIIEKNDSIQKVLEVMNYRYTSSIQICEKWDISKTGIDKMSSFIEVTEMERRHMYWCYITYTEAIIQRVHNQVLSQIKLLQCS